MAGYNRFQKILEHQLTAKPKGESYTGEWHGKTVTFDRVYRGHRFTDVECARLCNGLTIQLYNLERNGVYYAIEGKLESDDIKIGDKVLSKIVFRKIRDIFNDPDMNSKSDSENLVNHSDINMFSELGGSMDDMQHNLSAQMEAMLSAPMMPLIRKVQEGSLTQLPKYEPVLGFDAYFRSEHSDAVDVINEDMEPVQSVDMVVNQEPGFEDNGSAVGENTHDAEDAEDAEDTVASEIVDTEESENYEDMDISHYYDELYSDHSLDEDDSEITAEILREYMEEQIADDGDGDGDEDIG